MIDKLNKNKDRFKWWFILLNFIFVFQISILFFNHNSFTFTKYSQNWGRCSLFLADRLFLHFFLWLNLSLFSSMFLLLLLGGSTSNCLFSDSLRSFFRSNFSSFFNRGSIFNFCKISCWVIFIYSIYFLNSSISEVLYFRDFILFSSSSSSILRFSFRLSYSKYVI